MELEQLRIFSALARKGGFAAAGRELYISHSKVSRTVRALEEELGVPLVRRSNSFGGLTPEGEALKAEADRILAEIDDLKMRISASSEK